MAEGTFRRGDKTAAVTVTVAPAKFKSIALVPERVQVAVESTAAVRVVGRTDAGREAEVSADEVTWETLPSPQFADFDPDAMTVRGVAPTGEQTQPLAARLGDLRAGAQVEVVAAPFRLDGPPPGPAPPPGRPGGDVPGLDRLRRRPAGRGHRPGAGVVGVGGQGADLQGGRRLGGRPGRRPDDRPRELPGADLEGGHRPLRPGGGPG